MYRPHGKVSYGACNPFCATSLGGVETTDFPSRRTEAESAAEDGRVWARFLDIVSLVHRVTSGGEGIGDLGEGVTGTWLARENLADGFRRRG